MRNSTIFKLLTSGLKKIKANFEFASLRKLTRMYKTGAKIDRSHKPDSYLRKNLLDKKIEIKLACRKIGVMEGEI